MCNTQDLPVYPAGRQGRQDRQLCLSDVSRTRLADCSPDERLETLRELSSNTQETHQLYTMG
jgi:hypothetical protein